MIIIKENSMRRKSHAIQSIFFCFFRKAKIAIINIKRIAPVLSFEIAGFTNIDIQQSIAIHIRQSYTG